MFKSIEYKLYLYVILLIASVSASTYFALKAEYVYAAVSIFVVCLSLRRLHRSYNQFNKNILFLLNALDNGDYSFNFTETNLSRRERELNQMMNRIKEILSKARKEVIENEKFLSVIIESVSTGIILLDEDNRLMHINRTVNELLGMPVFTHLNQLATLDPSFPDLFRTLEASDTKTIHIANEREEVQISLRVSEIIMKRRKVKIITLSNIGSELDYKEMDSWIRLIRVMTHEIMNSIAPITSLTDTLLFAYRQAPHAPDNELMQDTVEAFQTINTTAKGLINFVNSYRKFTGVPKPQLKPVALSALIERAVALESPLFEEKGISVDRNVPPGDQLRSVDESQVMQVLVNLLKNASEAIVAGKGGRIKIELREEKDRFHVDVCNNGEPIAAEVLPNIFVPFFTTKNAGTGIGLSVSRYIMRLHGGNLSHFTQHEWTVFRMTFPN
ncbi:sensor histidine kinase [Limibacterium fermenti]|uniref:sensor histidine kinase n=1 Tax=Limibacterium fermenti TaxID=3229863 RepID=UPI000E8A948D|nr:ATP-binding protein [Porphyromonadaceae bacterium]HBX46045.1 ATP-binding protein [Porphyromonadaceae bacterium]